MDTSAYDRLKKDFTRVPAEKWGAILSSIGAAVAYLLLLVLLYLFVDLLVWRGHVPTYAQLSAARQRDFASEWQARPEADRRDAIKRVTGDKELENILVGGEKVRPPTAAEWELRWQAGVYLALRERAGEAPADAYLPEERTGNADSPPQLGVLSLVARERNRWTGQTLAGSRRGTGGCGGRATTATRTRRTSPGYSSRSRRRRAESASTP